MSDFAMFKRVFGKRILDAWLEVDECWKIYQENGEVAFLEKLEEKEAFRAFCHEFYDYMRERWNACSGSMWDSFEEFRTKYDSDVDRYWAYLEKC